MQVSPLRQNTKYQTADIKKICNPVHIHSPLITQIFPHPHGGPLLPATLFEKYSSLFAIQSMTLVFLVLQ